MLDHTELKRGVQIIIDGEPYEILESAPMKKAQRRVIIQAKAKNLINGNVLNKNFHQGETFEEAGLVKFEAKFIYSHSGKFVFSEANDPSKRFDLAEEQIGQAAKFLKPSQIVQGIKFEGKIINISLPIKVQLKVVEAPPGFRGDRSSAGTKQIKLETGATINAPLFIKEGDVIEINTETEEYTRRAE